MFGRSTLIGLLVVALGCGNGTRPNATPDHRETERPLVRLLVVTDLQGQLEPCGCQSRPLGGLDRLATALGEARADGVPTIFLAAGDLLATPEPSAAHAGGETSSQQDAWRRATVVDILNRLNLAAVVSSSRDDHHADALAGLTAPDLGKRGNPIATLELKAGSVVVGVIGARLSADAELPRAELEQAARALRDKGAKLVVALVSADRRIANRAAAITGIDLTINGGIDNKVAVPPAEAGHGFVLSAGRHGEGLLSVDVFRRDQSPLVDRSEWSRKRDHEARAQTIAELKAKLAAWQAQPNVDVNAVAAQRTRLEALERENAAGLTLPPAPSAFIARLIEVAPEIARETAVDALIDAYDLRVNEHNKVAFADVKAPPAGEGRPRYVGAESCRSCHQGAFSWWREHKHGHAYATLEAVNKQFNLSCVGCHVTGYQKPGGSAVVQNAGLTDVGCESCHGPGSQHVDDPDEEPYSVQRVVPADVCTGCHNQEHSDKFDYPTYRERLLVPGHGKPVVPAAPPETP